MQLDLRNLGSALSIGLAISACDASREPPPHLRIEGGDATVGRQLIVNNGCGTCHVIPGVPGAIGMVGPPLNDFAQRTVLAGTYPNVPRWLVPWLMDPPALQPATAMPNLGLSAEEAGHIATYLYTLGAAGVAPYEYRPATSQYPWLEEADAYREAETRRLFETERIGTGKARIPIERAMELLTTTPEAGR
ncbi:MAG TPA: c-type cytochrome [Hyphomicrobiaceae bacterium]